MKAILLLILIALCVPTASAHDLSSGTLSRPTLFGNQTLRLNNGAVIELGRPNMFGDRSIRVLRQPRKINQNKGRKHNANPSRTKRSASSVDSQSIR
jgi:hypothetical protein